MDENNTPYWYRLLKHFEVRRYFENGLTIPFIIGSRQFLEPAKPRQTVEELLNEFSQSSYQFNVLMCDQFGEYMFRITEDTYGYYEKIENFILHDNLFPGKKTVREIIPGLNKRYAENLANDLFSRIPGDWVPYTSIDLKRLKECKQK